jgi:hypothetical protein
MYSIIVARQVETARERTPVFKKRRGNAFIVAFPRFFLHHRATGGKKKRLLLLHLALKAVVAERFFWPYVFFL